MRISDADRSRTGQFRTRTASIATTAVPTSHVPPASWSAVLGVVRK